MINREKCEFRDTLSYTHCAFAARPKSRRSKTDESVAEHMPPPCTSSVDMLPPCLNTFSRHDNRTTQEERKKRKQQRRPVSPSENREGKEEEQESRDNPEAGVRREPSGLKLPNRYPEFTRTGRRRLSS